MSDNVNIETEKNIHTYSKQQILRSKAYADKQDIIDALLEDHKEYTLESVDEIIKKFMEMEVK